QTVGRRRPESGCASARRPRAREPDVERRRRAADDRGREAGASLWRDAGLLGLPKMCVSAFAPFYSRWVGVLPCLWATRSQIETRPASCSSCGEAPPQAWRCAGFALTAATKTEILESGLLSTARRRTSPARARAPGNVE